jgi:hypothetical protein
MIIISCPGPSRPGVEPTSTGFHWVNLTRRTNKDDRRGALNRVRLDHLGWGLRQGPGRLD